jgi:hypothetical protein
LGTVIHKFGHRDEIWTKKKKAKPKLTDKEQSERFKQIARELGVDESGEPFEKAFRAVAGQDKPRE